MTAGYRLGDSSSHRPGVGAAATGLIPAAKRSSALEGLGVARAVLREGCYQEPDDGYSRMKIPMPGPGRSFGRIAHEE